MTDISEKTPNCPDVPWKDPEAGGPRKNQDVFSDFHGSGVNTSGSCTFLQRKKKIKKFPVSGSDDP